MKVLLSAAVLGIPVAAVCFWLKACRGRQLLFEDHIADMQNNTVSRQELFEDRRRVSQTLSLMTQN